MYLVTSISNASLTNSLSYLWGKWPPNNGSDYSSSLPFIFYLKYFPHPCWNFTTRLFPRPNSYPYIVINSPSTKPKSTSTLPTVCGERGSILTFHWCVNSHTWREGMKKGQHDWPYVNWISFSHHWIPSVFKKNHDKSVYQSIELVPPSILPTENERSRLRAGRKRE